MNDISIERWEIWNVDLGWGEGSEQRGLKPCLIIQNDLGNDHSTTTIVLPITSKRKGFNKTHVKLVGVLPRTSYVLCEQIRVISKVRLHERIGKIGTKHFRERNEIEKALALQLEI